MSDARTVLIVEDDVAFADFLRTAVESVGHRAIVVTNAGEALPAFDQHCPEFALIDILLPQGDGFEVCKSIRAHERGGEVPIALMTGIYKKASYERQGLQDCRANEFVHKPFGVQALWRMLETHLGAVTGDAQPEDPAECFDLADRPLVEVLAEHVENDSNGVLFVRSRDITYAIYLQWGDPVFIRSNDPGDRLHEVLRRSGQVTNAQVEKALEAVAESRGRLRLGQALVRRGDLTEDQFQVALQLQLRLIFQHAFQLTEGTCSFSPGSHPTEEDVLVAIRPRALLLLGAKATAARSVVAGALPAENVVLTRSGEFDSLQEELGLKGPERALAQLVDGTLTAGRFRAIAESSGADGTALLHGLLLTGLLCVGDAELAEPPGPSRQDWVPTRFAQLPVAAAVADLHRVGACGTLEVRAAAQGPAKRVVFRQGAIAAVQSDVEEDRLSDMLVRLHLISESELDGILQTFGGVEPDDCALARAIVGSGQVMPLQVYWAAVYQAQAAVHGLFGMVGAKLTWTGGEEPPGTVGLPDMPTSEIVLGAVRSLAGATLHALLPPKTTWFQALEDEAGRVGGVPLNDDERALLQRLETPVQLAELLAEQPQVKTETRRRLFGLLSCRLVGEAAPRAGSGGELVEAVEALEEEGSNFLDMLHEDGFASEQTGCGPMIEPQLLEEEPITLDESPDTGSPLESGADLESAIEPEPEVSPTPASEPASDDDPFSGDEPIELPIADFACSFAEEDEPLEDPGTDSLATCGRDLIGRLAAGRAALEAGGDALETHRDALVELLARCETLARRVMEADGDIVTARATVPSDGGGSR
jgi:CheY-like chemotaxis protein